MLLLISVLVYWSIPVQRIRTAVLIVASFAYLGFTDPWSMAVVAGLSLFSYAMGRLIGGAKRRGPIHALAVTGVLALLIVFKYLGMLTGVLNGLLSFLGKLPAFEIDKLILPLGLSYIVFKHISYLTDIKWGLVKPGRFDDFLLYSSLFTIYVAGPIERFERFQPQVARDRIPFLWSNIETGTKRVVLGMFKKLVLADLLGFYLGKPWNSPGDYAPAALLVVLMGYSLQIYFDFSGYSDMAIGASRLFGLRIMENFRNPYLAPNISQFWRRWHISLSDWIRDYVFFPLSRLGKGKIWLQACVPMIAMALCGMWHGSTWNYVLWGVWHGIGLAVYQAWNGYKRRNVSLGKTLDTKWMVVLSTFLNFLFVSVGWILFASQRPLSFLAGLRGGGSGRGLMAPVIGMLITVAGGLILFGLAPASRRIQGLVPERLRFYYDYVVYGITLAALLNFSLGSASFVYAGF